MTSKALDSGRWIDRLAGALSALAQAQEPYLQAYWQHHPREQVIVDGRDETPNPHSPALQEPARCAPPVLSITRRDR